jgi:hypothetical protein
VVRTGLQIARGLEHEVEARMEGELLEKVVVQPRSGRHPNATRSVESQPNGDSCLRCRTKVAHAPAGGRRDGRRTIERSCQRVDQKIVVLGITDRDTDTVLEHPHDDPAAPERFAQGLGGFERDEEEVPARRQR